MKIAVYAIALNEAAFVERWLDSAADADHVMIADTGSTDGTADWFYACAFHNIHISPWRFDHARNAALALLPPDIDLCITLDLDEILVPGWREIVESVWTPEATRLRYQYVWNHRADGSPDVQFRADRAHHRNGYQWRGPVHETVTPSGPEVFVETSAILIEHHADNSKSRGSYLPLLELAVRENPMDDRAAHYYGRELLFHGRNHEAVAELQRHLSLPTATWADERAASMRFIARATGDESWLIRATAEAPQSRDAWYELSRWRLDRNDYLGALQAAQRATTITQKPGHYLVTREAWEQGPWDVVSVAAWYLGMKDFARQYWEIAAAMAPNDERIRKNGEFIAA